MINKLLIHLLNELKKNGVKYGLCSIATNLYFNKEISWSKFKILKRYIDKHRPIYKYNILFGWRKSVKAPRIRWLKEHILLTK